MLARLRQWRANRQQGKQTRQFARGWDYAAGELLRGKDEEEVGVVTEGARLFGDYTAFDAGIDAALATHRARVYVQDSYVPFRPLNPTGI